MFNCKILNNQLSEGLSVVVKIKSIKNEIVTGELIEYGCIEGMILVGELSKKRIKNIGQATKIGKIEVCQIIKIDGKDIDLSLKRIESDEKAKVMEMFKKNKLAYSIMDKSSKILNIPINELYEKVGYLMADKYGNLFNYFAHLKHISDNKTNLNEKSDVEEKYENVFVDVINQRFKAVKYKIRADIDVSCSKFDGVSLVKEALQKGEEVDSKLEIQLLNTPTFSVLKTTKNKEEGFEIVNKALEAIKEHITLVGGEMHVMAEAQVFGEKTKHNILKKDLEEEESLSDDSDSSDE